MNLLQPLLYQAMLLPMRIHARRFNHTTHHLEQTQRQLLTQILTANTSCEFGHAHDFAKFKNFEDYRKAVPICQYDDLSHWIDRIADGHSGVLTTEKVLRFIPSSGSSAATKFIPYTKSLNKQFYHAISPWVASNFTHTPQLKRGRAYSSISPPAKTPSKYGVMPVGFGDDSDYLPSLGKWAYQQLFVDADPQLKCDDPTQFRINHAAALLAANGLTLISIWSPTYLLAVLQQITEYPDEVFTQLAKHLPSKRINHIRGALRDNNLKQIWPNLKLISCWCDGPSKTPAAQLAKHFPNVLIQPKGLMTTEAVISLTLATTVDPVLAATSHVIEFLDTTSGEIIFPWQTEIGSQYQPVVTTSGGLYRYNLGDQIQITGFHHTLPTMRFVGKSALISDLCGEKLNATFVSQCLDQLIQQKHIQPGFAMLAPEISENGKMRYVLWTTPDCHPADDLHHHLETLLNGNYHYKNCRHLNQLQPVTIKIIADNSAHALTIYQNHLTDKGLQPGNIKFSPLSIYNNWKPGNQQSLHVPPTQ